MNDTEQRALLGLSLMAALADGNTSDAERARLKQVVESLPNPALNTPALYQDVILRRVTAASFAQQLTSAETRQLAYEMATGVCESDGALNDAERWFLGDLRRELGIAEPQAAAVQQQADQIAAIAPPVAIPPVAPPTAPVPAANDSEVDSTILNHAILAGALELLPSSLATMAILPVQMRLVYRVGQLHGHALDRGHIGEFLATAGLGITSQVVEGYATKLMKGLLGKVGGGIGRTIAGAVTGPAMAFGTTWAIGHLAKRYYAGGRTLSGGQLREMFGGLLGQARGLQGRYLPEIQQRSRGLNLGEITRLARL
jgi:uncharacterized protein (DUF697 family)/tellurite resistance protein